jgi:hypothetical protein
MTIGQRFYGADLEKENTCGKIIVARTVLLRRSDAAPRGRGATRCHISRAPTKFRVGLFLL